MRSLFAHLLLASSLYGGDLTFPKLEEAHRVRGELVAADFIHRSGQFRTEKGGLNDFVMPPFAIMKYRGVEADMRDVPLGSKMDFLMMPDQKSLLTTEDGQRPDPEQQRKFRDFTEKRGVAGWITQTEAKTVTVSLFSGDPAFFESAYGGLLIKGKEARLCVANDELRTWNPGVDGERGNILDMQKQSADRFGQSGYQITVSVSNMLEGFRRGRVVRIFLQGWKVQDQIYGESLMGYGFGRMLNQELIENVAKEYPDQFPFRTDFSNAHLPWYQLEGDAAGPPFSEHLIYGDLVSADAKTGTGKFIIEKTDEAVNFSLIQKHTIKHFGKDTQFSNLPLGQRYRFHCYQDSKGQFTRVTHISDDFSHQAANHCTARVTSIAKDKLHLEWLLPLVKDYNGDMQRPEPFARRILLVNQNSKVWKGDQAVNLSDLKLGDEIRFNSTADLNGKPAYATEIWVVEDPAKVQTQR